jgi:hypothetical protein
MKSEKSIYIFVGVIVLIIAGYFVITNIKSYKWYESYDAEDKNPYGNYALTELLKTTHELQVVDGPLNETKLKRGNYLFVGSYFDIDSAQSETLLEYVKRGNNAYIFSNSQPYNLIQQFGQFDCDTLESEVEYSDEIDTTVVDSLVNKTSYIDNRKPSADMSFSKLKSSIKKKYHFVYVEKNKPEKYYWSYVDSSYFCHFNKIEVLGTIDKKHINYYRIKYGKGSFIFHTNPIVFTNYFLINKHAVEYGDEVFSDLKQGTIYWDEYNKEFHYNNSPGRRTSSPLKFILSEPALKAAWYLLLILVLLYIIFYSKRKQRIIPVLEGNYNTSIEFTESIGKLYFLQTNHQKLALQKMKYFLGFIRQRYHYATNTLDNNFIKRLSAKSGIPIGHVEVIFQQYKTLSGYHGIAEDTLINFHQALEYFYQNCK